MVTLMLQRLWMQARALAPDRRDAVLVCGLLMLHVGLRSTEVLAPGASWVVPGAVLTAIAVFGVRGGGSARAGRKE